MIPGDFKKLVGGYATGTLTPEERQALFQAALQDQGLFDALAREEALRDALSDPAARARLLAALDRRRWWWWSVPARALAAAAALSIGVFAGYWAWHPRPRHAVREVAAIRPLAAPLAVGNDPASAPAAKPVAPVRRLPAKSAPVRQSSPGTGTAQPVAPSPSGMGSLAPAPAAPPTEAQPTSVEVTAATGTLATRSPVAQALQSGAGRQQFSTGAGADRVVGRGFGGESAAMGGVAAKGRRLCRSRRVRTDRAWGIARGRHHRIAVGVDIGG